MSNPDALFVPMVVEAFVVNDPVRLRGSAFVRTQMQYGALQSCANAQSSLNGNDVNFTGANAVPPNAVAPSSYYNGVYLKWRLPDALTRGVHDSTTGDTTYPTVPNRWLVVRMSGDSTDRQATAWIVESDYVLSAPPSPATIADTASLYVGSEGNTPTAILIGRNVPLGSWTESDSNLRLTAMAPGNPAFAFYQPYNNNVFSFVDVLGDGPDDTLSYQVMGWYSDATDDPLVDADSDTFVATLAALGWTLAPDAGVSPVVQTTLLAGSVCGVSWQSATLPGGGAPGGDALVSVGVGNTSIEALTAMVAAQAAEAGLPIDAELLEAFQHNLLDILDEPDAAAVLAAKLQASSYQRFNGGYTWTIVDAPGFSEPLSPAERDRESAWLAVLCADQAELDAALRQLAALQAELYVAWWKYASWPSAYRGSTSIAGLDDQDALQRLIDPSVAGSIAQRTAAQMQTVQTLSGRVPGGATPEALQSAIVAFAFHKKLPVSRVLKRTNAQPFYLPNNPVVLISGAAASGIVGPGGILTCRLPSQLVTALNVPGGPTITTATVGLTVNQPDFSGVAGVPWTPALVTSLLDEFFLTDAANAAAVAALVPGGIASGVQTVMADPGNYTGCYPVGGVQNWSGNPWHPLLLFWQACYRPITHGTAEDPNWNFQDGRYQWNGAPQSVGPEIALSGLAQLSPAARFNMGARLKAFLQNNPNLTPQEAGEFKSLYKFVQTSDAWDLLSQSLNGFNEQLRLAMAGVFLGPDSTPLTTSPPLPTLIGNADGYPPALPPIPTGPVPPSNFQPWRAGQFVFTNLVVVDEWGQAVWPVNSASIATERIHRPPGLLPVSISDPVPFAITSGPSPAPASTLAPPSAAPPGPTITGVSPSLIQAGTARTARISLTITGSGFARDSVVQWNGLTLNVSSIASAAITADIPVSLLAAPGRCMVTVTSGGITSPPAVVTVSPAGMIAALDPPSVLAGGADFTLTATGVGFDRQSALAWNGERLSTTFVSSTVLTATIPATRIASAETVAVTEVVGHLAMPDTTGCGIQLPPALLQPARLNFTLVSATDDTVVAGPAAPAENPLCGWVLPSHLDASLLTYDPGGAALGTMSVGYDVQDRTQVLWTPLPDSPYVTLAQLAAALPHLGLFLMALQQQGAAGFTAFLSTIDESLWATAATAAAFDQDLATLTGAPLALVRARLWLELDGPPYTDPSWQYTFQPATPSVTGYRFPVELGRASGLSDGLVGYFVGDDYTRFNVVARAVPSPSAHLRPIGVGGRGLDLSFDGLPTTLSMLVDPRAAIHASTAILPTVELTLPQQRVSDALAAMDVMVRVDGALTDQTVAATGATTVLFPTPRQGDGTWIWVENDAGTWTVYATGANDATARLSTVPPVLRRGFLRLSSALAGGPPGSPRHSDGAGR